MTPAAQYLYCTRPKRSALGAVVRRQGLADGLIANGVAVELIEMLSPTGRLPEMLSLVPSALRSRKRLSSVVIGSGSLIIEGLPMAFALAIALPRRLPQNNAVYVDVCDSWYRLSEISNGSGSPLKNRLTSTMKRVAAFIASRVVARTASSFIYITDRDCVEDRRLRPPNLDTLVIPNGTVRREFAPASWDPDGPLLLVGDWAYPPNVKMLENTLEWLNRTSEKVRLRVVGPNLPPEYQSIRHVDYRGWVERLDDAYVGVACSAVLLSDGAGMKNKVLESIVRGVPVLGTSEAFSGISGISGADIAIRYRPEMLLDELRQRLRRIHECGGPMVPALPTWPEAAGPLAERLKGVVR